MKICSICQHFLAYDKALSGDDPWMSMQHIPYSSCKGCDMEDEPEKSAWADLSATERCVCNSVAKMINSNRMAFVRGGFVTDPSANDKRRQYRSVVSMEFDAMRERAEFCPTFIPRKF